MKIKNQHSGIKVVVFIPLLILSVIFLSCDNTEEPEKLKLQDGYEVTEGDYTFFANSEKYKEADVKRGQENFCQVQTLISKVKREGNILTIEILKPINCQVSYEIIWDGEIRVSHPMESNLYVHALAEDCNAMLFGVETDALVVDLEDTFKDIDKDIMSNTSFTIKDACSFTDVQCIGDCGITVSN